MVEVGKDGLRSSGQSSMLKQGHLEEVALGHVQIAFEYVSPRMKTPQFLWATYASIQSPTQ